MSRSEVTRQSSALTLPPPVSQEQPATDAGTAGAGTASVDAASNAGCTDCCDKIKLVPVTLPGFNKPQLAYLDEAFASKVQAFIDNAAANGVTLKFNDAYRTPTGQQEYRDKGIGITPAKDSLHSCGYAVDVNYSSLPSNEQRRIVREAAKKAGLKWGGTFRPTSDPPHFYDELPTGIDRKKAIQCATQQYNKLRQSSP